MNNGSDLKLRSLCRNTGSSYPHTIDVCGRNHIEPDVTRDTAIDAEIGFLRRNDIGIDSVMNPHEDRVVLAVENIWSDIQIESHISSHMSTRLPSVHIDITHNIDPFERQDKS